MPKFKYDAVDDKGKKVRNTIEAPTQEEAIELIHGKGFYPTKVKQIKVKGQAAKKRKKGKKRGFDINSIQIGGIPNKVINTFTRQLSTLQDAGIPIIQSLTILESPQKKGMFKNTLSDMIEDIQGGNSLSVAMSKHPKAFDKLYVNIVNAGEIGGALDIILRRLADYREKMQKLKAKIISSMTYPVAVICIATAIVAGIIAFIIPKFATMFDEMDLDLPLITRALVGLSDIMVNQWYLILGLPVAIVVFYKSIIKNRKVCFYKDKLLFKIPVMGAIINKSTISKFARTISTLISSGVPILEALSNVKEIAGNLAMEKAVEDIHNSIREGESISKPLGESKICDPIVVNMVAIGEQSGELDKMLSKIADNYDDEIDMAVDSMVSLIEPLLIVFLGGAVGTIVIALFMPLIALMDAM